MKISDVRNLVPGTNKVPSQGSIPHSHGGGECGGAVGSNESWIRLERHYRVFGHSVWTSRQVIFDAKVDTDRLKLRWTDDRHLWVACN